MARGIASIDALKARSNIDPVTRCWHYEGAKIKGHPRIWTLDLDRVEKAVMSGPRAVWYIAHGQPLRGRVAFMACWTNDCVCPVHVRAANREVMQAQMEAAGLLKGHAAVRAKNLLLARRAAGIYDTPEELVRAIRQAKGTGTVKQLSERFGLCMSSASRILRGQTFRHLLPPAEPVQPQPHGAMP